MMPPEDTQSLPWIVKNRNKYEILKKLSDVHQQDLKALDHTGNTALHLVFLNKRLFEKDIIELLGAFLDRGSDIDAETKHGKAVIHLAVNRRMRGVVDFLTQRKAEVNKRDLKGNSVAHDFVQDENKNFYELMKFDEYFTPMPGERESADFAKYLIEKGVDFDVRNDEGTSALKLSIEYNLQHIVQVLVNHTQDARVTNRRHKSLLHSFLETNSYCRNELYKQGSRKLWYSAYTSRYATKIVKSLLNRGISNSSYDCDQGSTCLQKAIEYEEDMKIIQMLVDDRLKNIGKDSAETMFSELLQSSSSWGESRTEYFLKILQSLITKGAHVNGKDKGGFTPIYRAVSDMDQRVVNFLSERGADFRAINNSGENTFHALAEKELVETREDNEIEGFSDLVVSKGSCDLNARSTNNETPLHRAVRYGNLPIARKLIESGAEINCKDISGLTPLHLAMFSQSEKLAELLLKSGADVNIKDNFGRRPLDVIVGETDKIELVTMLLERGAYVNAHNDWESPFWEAVQCGHDRQVEEMLSYGANVNNIVDSLLKSLQKPRYKPASPIQNRFVLQHWIKLKVAKMPCSEKYEISERKSREDCKQLRQDCLKEIERLKGTLIDDCISIYSFLHMDFGYRRKHMNNEKLRQLVESPELKQLFPHYSVVILASYRETVMWKSLLEPAKRAWLQLTNVVLPDECIERIIAHLRIEDLVSMIEHDETSVNESSVLRPERVDFLAAARNEAAAFRRRQTQK